MNDEKKAKLFEADHPASKLILEWWEGLKLNKGDRAELRRCKNLEDVQITSAFQRCYWKIVESFKQGERYPSKEQMATIVGLSAHIEKNDMTDIFGYQISEGKDSPKMSELRFRRFLRINDRKKLYRFLIQIIRLLDKKANMLDLQKIAYFWGDREKKKLAYKYYEKAVLK